MRRSAYSQETEGIRVTVRPIYLPDHSTPEDSQFVFAYFVRIENTSRRTVKLLTRHWHIHDSNGEDREVGGEGVVGQQPEFPPGHIHEYQSFCVLRSRSGHMEGSYRFIRADDSLFDVAIPRFYLTVPR